MAKPSIEGKRVVLTGTFSGLRREDAEAALERLGAIVSGSVSKTTDILFAAADAGSKRAKAEALGVLIHDEAALLRIVGAPKPAVTSAKSPKPTAKASKPTAATSAKKEGAAPEASAAASTASSAKGLGDELRAFVAALKKRKDIVVTVADVRKPASAREIANADIPADLADFYAATNGAEIAWKFAEGPGAGSMRILALGESGFVDDDESGMGFGRTKEAYLFDETTAEAGVWLVRKKGSSEAKLVFASAADGVSGIAPAASIAEYVRKAIANGLVPYWPLVEKPRKGLSTAAEELAIARFRGAPTKAGTIAVGARVSFDTGNERGRGEVLALRDQGPLVRLRVDDGREAWLDREHVMALAGTDDYEALRKTGLGREGTVVARGEKLVRALGAHSIDTFCALGVLPSTSLRAAGILGKKAYPEAVDEVLAYWEEIRGIVPARGDDALPSIGKPATRALTAAGLGKLSLLDRAALPALLDMHGVGPKAVRILETVLPPATDTTKAWPLAGKGAAFAVEVKGVKTFTLEAPLRALLGALVHLAFRESATKKTPGKKLVPAATVARLERLVRGARGAEVEVARSLLGALGSPKVLPHPVAALDERTKGRRGLPKSEGVGLTRWIDGMPLFPFRD